MHKKSLNLVIDNSLTNSLSADPTEKNYRRQVNHAYSFVKPEIFSDAELVHVSSPLALKMGLSEDFINSTRFEKIVTGQELYPHTMPYSLNYAGHQFGNWAGQLGDGRAINLFESVFKNKRFTWQLKGAGETPYSRSADGKAVLRSSIREHICSEAMYFLGVPTTRSLSLSLTGQDVLRDMMYDGNAAYENGAVVCRVAPTFIRFGSFQIFAAKRDKKQLKDLLEYTISIFFPDILLNQDGYNQFFQEVVDRTLHLMIEWMRVGFVHGVMNTDNMSILGLTIDYGPYGWLDNYDPNWTPNTTDAGQRRYRYGNQANIGLWNLYQLANALNLIVKNKTALENSLKTYQDNFNTRYQTMMLRKLGLKEGVNDSSIIEDLQRVMLLSETDFTIFFRELAGIETDMTAHAALPVLQRAFYKPDEIKSDVKEAWLSWLTKYINEISNSSTTNDERRIKMNKINPKYIFRNYIAQEIIEDAEKGNYEMLNEVFDMIQNPYAEAPRYSKYYRLRPDYARYKIGSSQLSCSS